MTFMTIPAASIAGMVFSLVVSFALPIGLFVYAKKKLGAKTAPFFIGCGVFFVMVLMLEAAIHRIVFQLAGEALTGSVILYAVYGGLMAALFEETGRYIAMRFLVKPMEFSECLYVWCRTRRRGGNASVRRGIYQQRRKCRDDKFRHHVCTAGDS